MFLDIEEASEVGFPYRGKYGAVVMLSMSPGSVAEKSGLLPGDVIFRYEGEALPVGDTVALLREKVIPLKLQGNVTRTIGVWRNGAELEIKVT